MKTPARVLLLLFVSAVFVMIAPSGVNALIAAHQSITCIGCHNLHGGATDNNLTIEVSTEATCLSCHGPLNPFGITEAAIHDPIGFGVGNQGYISCRECHNPHDNLGNNIKLVGYEYDPQTGLGASAAAPQILEITNPPDAAIRIETSSEPAPDPLNPYNSNYSGVVFESVADFSRGASNNGPCQVCHTAGPTTGGDSGVGNFNGHAWGDNCATCHQHSDGFKKRHCVECHDDNATLSGTAPRVLDKAGGSAAAIGTHLQSFSGEAIVGLTDFEWTAQCIKCHTGHSGDVLIPNNATVGIDYQRTGGIGLGGSATNGTSEAGICWDCHDTNTGGTVSEWNALTDHGFTVTGGSDWTAVSFDLAGTTVPTKSTTAIHSVNASVPEATASSVTANLTWAANAGWGVDEATIDPTKTLEDKADIRCSYCHDVHGTFGGPATDAAPYLRGTWLHNPYVAIDIERPPESGDNWTGNRWSHFDAGANPDTVPRLRTDAASGNLAGGYQIDQNNNMPTSSYLDSAAPSNELTDTAGLCVLCHGSDVDNMDQFSTRNLWAASNGHSNASLGGTGGLAANIFDARNRNGQLSTAMGFYMAGLGADNWDNLNNVNRWGDQNSRNQSLPYGNRGDSINPDDNNSSGNSATPPRWNGYMGGPAIAGTARNTDVFSSEYDAWFNDATGSNGGIGSNGSSSGRAHDFSCSKCHTPHASGMPALLVTNCLDYTVSDWSETASGPKGGNSVTLGPTATNRWALEAMNNCHRKDDNNSPGWNLLAPRQ